MTEMVASHGGDLKKTLWTRHATMVLLIIFGACSIRFIGLGEKQLWVDEIIQVLHSRPDSIGEILKSVAEDRGAAPLDYVVQHFVMKAAGRQDETSARMHAAILGSISVVLVYLLALGLLGETRTALLSAALFAIYPFHHHYSQEGRPYALFVFLALCLFILYVRARAHFPWPIVLWMSLAAVLAFYAHPFTIMIFGTFFFIGIVRSIKGGHKLTSDGGIIAAAFSCLLGICAFIPWLAYSFHNSKGDSSPALSLALIAQAIKEIGDGSYPLSLILVVLCVFGVAYLWKTNRGVLADLSCWIAIPIPLILLLLYWRSYFFATRQMIFITPAIIILAACGIDYLISVGGRRMIVVPLAYACVSLVVIGLHFKDNRADFRGVGNYLRQTMTAEDRIVAPNVIGLLEYYFPGIRERGQDGMNFELPDAPKGRLFIVDTQYSTDLKGEVYQKAQNRMTLKEQLPYRGIRISIFAWQ